MMACVSERARCDWFCRDLSVRQAGVVDLGREVLGSRSFRWKFSQGVPRQFLTVKVRKSALLCKVAP